MAQAPLLEPLFGRRAHVRPVSRISFEATDRDAFERCIELSVDWMTEPPRKGRPPRSGIDLPTGARTGEPFDVTDVLGANPAKAIRIDAADGSLWVARLDWPDADCPRSWISEFFVERRAGRRVRFGAQLTCVMRDHCPPFEPTRPRLVRSVLEGLACEADGQPLADVIEPTRVQDIPEIVDLLYRPDRRLPVLVISEGTAGRSGLAANRLSKRIGGAAHIVDLTDEASWELTRAVGKRMSVFNGAVRLYNPGLSEESEDPFSHPLWLGREGGVDSLQRQISDRVLTAAFLRENNDYPFHRYSKVRDIATRRVLKQGTGSELDQLKSELELLREEASEHSEDRDVWQSLAQSEQDKRIEVEREVEELKAEVVKLRSKSEALQNGYQERAASADPVADRALLSYDDLEDWSEEVLGDAVYIHPTAIKDCRKNGHANMLSRIEKSLLIMRDHMTPARRGEDGHKEEARKKLLEIGMNDSACFVDREEAKRRPGYSVVYGGGSRVLYDHIKYGNGYDNSNQIRIYYFWDDEAKRHVVGKMPSHLKNNMTN